MANPPEDHADLAAVAVWVLETVEAQEAKGARHIMIPLTMMRMLLGVVHWQRDPAKWREGIAQHVEAMKDPAFFTDAGRKALATLGDGEVCLYCGTSAEECANLPHHRCCDNCRKFSSAHVFVCR